MIKVKEESEKAGLKLNIQKTKIMASGPITSWQIDGEAMEAVTRLYFLGLQNHCRSSRPRNWTRVSKVWLNTHQTLAVGTSDFLYDCKSYIFESCIHPSNRVVVFYNSSSFISLVLQMPVREKITSWNCWGLVFSKLDLIFKNLIGPAIIYNHPCYLISFSKKFFQKYQWGMWFHNCYILITHPDFCSLLSFQHFHLLSLPFDPGDISSGLD